MSHAASPELVKRLKRAQGHLATIIKMIEKIATASKSRSNCRRSWGRSTRQRRCSYPTI
jgi:hypothetical protein